MMDAMSYLRRFGAWLRQAICDIDDGILNFRW